MYLLSIDLESWVQRPIYNLPLDTNLKRLDNEFSRVCTEKLLKLLNKYNRKATFFVLGRLIEWYPEIIDRILEQGHEIAYHGFSHEFVHNLSVSGFKREIETGLELLRFHDVSPKGFRSPSFSRFQAMTDILKVYGYQYDSSVIPIRTPLYDGSEFKNSKPFVWENGLVEIPISVFVSGSIKIPLGGFYLRLMGPHIQSYFYKRLYDSIHIVMLYIHPWELFKYNDYGAGHLPIYKRLFAKYRLPALDSFEAVLERYPWDNVQNNWKTICEMAMKSN
ncbi:MAG: polysaccharide deacetylase family protein [Desulfobacter sp.]